MAKSQDSSFLPPPRILTRGRFLVLILGFLSLTANSMAQVNYDTTTHTFTGSGTYDQAVNETVDVTVTPTDRATITFTGNVTTTETFIHNGAHVIFDAGTTNSFGIYRLYNRTIDDTHYVNDSSMTLNGNLTVTNFQAAGRVNNYSGTSYIYINEGASLNVSGAFWIAEANKAQGIIDQNGGTVTITTSVDTDVRIGHWFNKNYPTEYNLKDGVLNIPNTVTHVGWDAYAKLNISGGEANLKGINLSAGGKTVDGALGGKGFLNLTGGTLNLGSEGVTYIKAKTDTHGDPVPYNTETAPEINLGKGTINASASHSWADNLTVTLTGTTDETATVFNAGTGKTITIDSIITGSGGLKKTGAGTLTLTNANTYTGETIVQNGVLMLTKGGSSGSLYKGSTVTVNGSTAVIAGNGDAGGNGDVFGYGANSVGRINLNNGGSLTNDSSTGHITVGSVIYMNNGIINTTDPTATGSDASGNFVFDNAIYVTAGTNNEISVQKFAIRHLNNTPYASGDDGGVFDVDQDAKLTISSIIIDKATTSGTKVPLVKRGAGTLTLSGANTYTTGTTISGGTLKLTGAGTLGTGAVTNSGTLEFAHTDDITFSNVISGTGAVTKTGTGTLTLSGANTYTGGTTVSTGKLVLINDALENAQGEFTVGENGTLEFYVAEGTKELSLSAQNELFITGKVIKTGEGELKIDAADLGSIDAQSFVISSGRVDIKTYFKGQLEVKNGATFSPGNSVGPLTITGPGIVDLGETTYGNGFILSEEGATLLMEIGGSDVTDNDVLIVQNGNILLGSGIIELAMTDDCTLGLGESFTAVLSAENSGEGLDVLGHIQTSDFTDLKYVLLDSGTYNGLYAITGRRFTANEVPEPSTWALLLLGAAGLLYVRKRTK